MNRCRHRSREEAMDCPLFRARKIERIPPLHGPNEFRWQLTTTQNAILGCIAFFDPRPEHVDHIFGALRKPFNDSPEDFAADLFELRLMGLVWIDCESGRAGYSDEGRQHVEDGLAERGTSLALMRLGVQAAAPSTFNYPIPLVDRVIAFLADREMVRKSVTGEYARVQ